MQQQNVAMVIGASGVTGTPMAEQLALAGWKVYGVSRRAPQLGGGPHAGFHHLSFDLTDPRATRAALAPCADVTHVFYCANDGRPETRLAITATCSAGSTCGRPSPDFSGWSRRDRSRFPWRGFSPASSHCGMR